MEKRTIYCKPVTELLWLPAENLLTPNTWNPDQGHGGNDMGIIEGDPEGDGKGAKENNPYAFFELDWESSGLWGDDSDSLWD